MHLRTALQIEARGLANNLSLPELKEFARDLRSRSPDSLFAALIEDEIASRRKPAAASALSSGG